MEASLAEISGAMRISVSCTTPMERRGRFALGLEPECGGSRRSDKNDRREDRYGPALYV